MAAIKKVEIFPITPTEITHHRELPVGSYHTILTGFMQNLYLLGKLGTKDLYLVKYLGKGKLLDRFEIFENGSIEYDDPNHLPHP